MKKMIRINMDNLQAKMEDTPIEFARLGGRGLSSHIIHTEVPPTWQHAVRVDPLGQSWPHWQQKASSPRPARCR